MVVDDVVSALTHHGVNAGKGPLGHRGSAGDCARSSIQRRGQLPVIDPCIDHLDARHL
jgi:hypothetical protein